MYTGTMIDDLVRTVERAENRAREQEFKLEFRDYPALQREVRELTEVA